jgi:hypothetical protein
VKNGGWGRQAATRFGNAPDSMKTVVEGVASAEREVRQLTATAHPQLIGKLRDAEGRSEPQTLIPSAVFERPEGVPSDTGRRAGG